MNDDDFVRRVQSDLAHFGLYSGAVDGRAGSGTIAGYEELIAGYAAATNQGRPETPISNHWPADNHAAIVAFYGQPGDDQLIRMPLPYEMRLSWDKRVVVRSIGCHAKVASSLQRIFTRIFEYYGKSREKLEAAGMLDYGGCYNYRKMRGGNTWSRHAWAIAIDLDPERNGLHTPWPGRATMPLAVIDIFEAEGWKSGARAWGRDAMHFQATGA